MARESERGDGHAAGVSRLAQEAACDSLEQLYWPHAVRRRKGERKENVERAGYRAAGEHGPKSRTGIHDCLE